MLTVNSGIAFVMISHRRLMSCTFLLVVPASYNPASLSLVSTTVVPSCSKSSFTFNAICRFRSFSSTPLIPTFPGSSPPCPASITIQFSDVFTSSTVTSLLLTTAAPSLARKNMPASRSIPSPNSNFRFIFHQMAFLQNMNFLPVILQWQQLCLPAQLLPHFIL